MIKDILFSCLVLFASSNAFPQMELNKEVFTLTGKIKGELHRYVFLKYINKEGNKVIDSSKIEKGNFYFKGNIIEPTLAIFSESIKPLPDNDPNVTNFYLEAGNMTAKVEKDYFKKIKITGSKTQQEKEIFERRIATIVSDLDSPDEKISFISYEFIARHPHSYYSAFLLALYKSRWTPDSVRQLYNEFNPKIQNSFYGKEVAESINQINNNSAGHLAKSFTAKDITGISINLSDFKGEYVLLDFWASWCVPCRKGNPHLIELFNKYHCRGLNIIGISADDNIEAWKTAVKKDKVGMWYNILSELKTNSNIRETDAFQSISREFGISVLPTKILIDKNGIIIGRYKGTEEEPKLDKKLSEIFD
jgi:thiol-disulfide isomerase/thioredoxin